MGRETGKSELQLLSKILNDNRPNEKEKDVRENREDYGKMIKGYVVRKINLMN